MMRRSRRRCDGVAGEYDRDGEHADERMWSLVVVNEDPRSGWVHCVSGVMEPVGGFERRTLLEME